MKLKKPKLPKAPTKPLEPTAPSRSLPRKIVKFDIDAFKNLKQLLDATKDIAPEKIEFVSEPDYDYDHTTYDCYVQWESDVIELNPWYNDQLIKYKRKMEEYETKMKIYEQKKEIYDKEVAKYEKDYHEYQIKYLEQQLNKLKKQ